MKNTVKKAIMTIAILALATAACFAKVSLRSTFGAARFFEMSVEGKGGVLVDGVSAGVDALLDMGQSTVSLEANAKKAADSTMSVLTFSASFYRDAEVMEGVSLFLKSGVETHLVLSGGIGTELGLSCEGGINMTSSDNFQIVMSASVSNMFFSNTCSTMFDAVTSTSGMVGMNAGVECSYKF